MKKLLLSLVFLLAPVLCAASTAADAWPVLEGLEGSAGTQTYALASAVVSSTSSSVDLNTYTGVYVYSTGTAQTGVAYQFSMDNSAWGPASSLPHGAWGLKKKGRYIRFKGVGPATGTVTIRYAVASAPSTGTVTLATPTPGIMPVSPTTSVLHYSTGTFTWTTHTTQTQAFTVRANVLMRAIRGGTSVTYDITASATPGAYMATLDAPMEVVTGASQKVDGPCYQSPFYVHARASGTASVVGSLSVIECK